jgi:putative ABC transport system ATP-binding protein
MKSFFRISFAAFALSLFFNVFAVTETKAQGVLNEILKRMEAHRGSLTSLRSSVKMVKYNAQLKESDTTEGTSTEDLTKIYKIGKVEVPALRGVSLDIKEGEFVAIMGPSGCGKSTLLHLLGGLLSPTSGKIIIDDEDLSKVSDAQRTEIRRRKIGFVFQRFNLFPTLTADGNLRLAERIHSGNGGGSAENRREVLRLLKLEDKMNHKPLELSGGEQQRVALARAVINNPAIILADEPTGNLDTENSRIVLDMFSELNQRLNQTIIMITHNPEAAANCNRTIQMRDGRIET